MAFNNDPYYDAALAGAAAAMAQGQLQTDTTQTDYDPATDVGVAIATAVDSAIPTETTSVAKANLIQQLTYASFEGRNVTGITNADDPTTWEQPAAAIAAMYQNTKGSLV